MTLGYFGILALLVFKCTARQEQDLKSLYKPCQIYEMPLQ